ncbi:MAG: hypothetical protein ACKVKG_15355, partial [Alphaproteobacteria bacterium]
VAAEGVRAVYDPVSEAEIEAPLYRRDRLAAGMRLPGPALIVEDETSTFVAPGFDAALNGAGYIIMTRNRG